jgi:hypothetical protein
MAKNEYFDQFETLDLKQPGMKDKLLSGKNMAKLDNWLCGEDGLNYRKNAEGTTIWNCSSTLLLTRQYLERVYAGQRRAR